MIVFNSFPRSGNVFMSTLGNFLNIRTSAAHDPELYYNSKINQCSYFREPKDCISSLIYRGMKISESNGKAASWEDTDSIDRLIIIKADKYKHYVKSAVENRNTLYIGNFLNIKDNPYNEIVKISNFFNTEIDNRWEFNFEKIKWSLYSQNLMSDPDGHLPSTKSQRRLDIETYIQQSSLLDDAIMMYESLQYNNWYN